MTLPTMTHTLTLNPGQMTLIGGAVIVVTVALHTLRRLSQPESPA